ncbi:TraK domain-containing protein [Thiomicrorhabdus aquaedulcis]|uniref:TraK domain-containing protein n=1 Tax=Thiomicrorhabdus aquaedulcis TaxID=2211106 RepID=UPI000FDBE0A5|nr:type-F conjugative transfer system secretin TraK [Thiomicrorhabdus aquaedulcis]
MMKKRLLPILLLSLAATSSVLAQGLDIVAGQKIDISVGTDDYSMLDVMNRSVLHVDVDYSKCDLASERSQKVGKIIFKPAGDKPFTMFITDNFNETYTVNVKVDKKKKPDLYTIKNIEAERKLEEVRSSEQRFKESSIKAIELTSSRDKAIHDLTRAMALNDTPKNVDIVVRNVTVPVWLETEVIEKNNYKVGNLTGIKYELINVSSKPMILAEAEFYTLNEKTLSVAIENHTLNPGEMTQVYVIKSNQD